MPSLELGLGLWQGSYQDIERLWLRWYDGDGNWMLTPAEMEAQRVIQERQRAENAEDKIKRLAAKLQELGLNPDEL